MLPPASTRAQPISPAPRASCLRTTSAVASEASPVRALSLSPRYRPEAELHFDLSLERRREVVAPVYPSGVPRVFAVGAPVSLEVRAPGRGYRHPKMLLV